MAEKEYIEREAMVKASCERCNGEYAPCVKEHCLLMEVIHSIPAADVRPVVKGRWEYEWKPMLGDVLPFKCSACGKWARTSYDFCPYCGASMSDGEDNNVPTKESEEVSAVRCWLMNGADMREEHDD